MQQPVLQVVPAHESRRADLAARDGGPRVLDERIAAIVERHGRHDAGSLRFVHELSRLRRRHRQRLVRHHVLALSERGGRHFVVQVVGRGIVDDVHVGVVDQRLITAVSSARADRLGLLPARCLGAAGDRHDVDVAETPHRIDVMRADEAGSDETHSNSCHASPPI